RRGPGLELEPSHRLRLRRPRRCLGLRPDLLLVGPADPAIRLPGRPLLLGDRLHVHDADPEDRPLLLLLHARDHADVPLLRDLLSLQPAAGLGQRGRLVHAPLSPGRDHPRPRHRARALVDRRQRRLARRRQRPALHHPGAGAAPEARRRGAKVVGANARGPRIGHNAAVVIRRGGTSVALLAALAALALPATAASAATGAPTLDLNGPKSPGLLDKMTAAGTLPGATGGENVTVTVTASGNTVAKKQLSVGGDGRFSYSFQIDSCCNYVVTASSGGQTSQPDRFNVGVPKHLTKGGISHLYNQALVDEGYYTGGRVSGKFNHGSQLATLAFRKVNNMARNYQYKPVIFEKLLQGRGGFQPRYRDGRHA